MKAIQLVSTIPMIPLEPQMARTLETNSAHDAI
jgi:hypothetical protein